MLKDKVAIVTGSAANIGAATARLFAAQGAKVVITSKTSQTTGEAVAREIVESGGRALYVQADLTELSDVDALFEKTLSEFGHLDILVNNAGVARSQSFPEITKAAWNREFDDNLLTMVICSQKAAQIMSNGSAILNTTSIRGIEHTGREGIMAYSAAKAAAISFTKTLAKELAPKIRVNSVAPGFVITPNYDKTSEATKAQFIANTLIKRWIQPEEIAQAFLYLATAEAVTGENLVVDGGFTLKIG